MAKPVAESPGEGGREVAGAESARAPVTGEERRYERKFVTHELSLAELTMRLRTHAALFTEIYAPRWVNSVYWDTAGLTCYLESVEGIGRRAKFRVRWYGDLFGRVPRPILEIKRKIGHEGWKELRRVPPFDVEPGISGAALRRAVLGTEFGSRNRELLNALEPVLLDRYLRRYYRSADGRFRLTVDTDVSWFALRSGPNALIRPWTDPGALIVELKYDCVHDADASRVTEHLPFRLVRNSKYAQGIEALRF